VGSAFNLGVPAAANLEVHQVLSVSSRPSLLTDSQTWDPDQSRPLPLTLPAPIDTRKALLVFTASRRPHGSRCCAAIFPFLAIDQESSATSASSSAVAQAHTVRNAGAGIFSHSVHSRIYKRPRLEGDLFQSAGPFRLLFTRRGCCTSFILYRSAICWLERLGRRGGPAPAAEQIARRPSRVESAAVFEVCFCVCAAHGACATLKTGRLGPAVLFREPRSCSTLHYSCRNEGVCWRTRG